MLFGLLNLLKKIKNCDNIKFDVILKKIDFSNVEFKNNSQLYADYALKYLSDIREHCKMNNINLEIIENII